MDSALQSREAADRSLPATFRRSSFGILVVDLDGRPTAVNLALCHLLGREPDALLGRPWAECAHPADAHLAAAVMAQVPGGGASLSSELRYLRGDGSLVWLQVNVDLVRREDDQPLYLIAQVQDITVRKHTEQEMTQGALYDALTGLPNRALLTDRLEHALLSAGRSGARTGVAFLDVNGVMHVNDSLGHGVGDQLLVEVGHRLARSVRPGDTVARFGGDTFVVVCCGVDLVTMSGLAGRVGETMEMPFSICGREVAVHVNLGVTVSRSGSTGPSLLAEADAAMYRAKELGEGRAALFDDSLPTRAEARLERSRALRAAVQRREVVAYYQPIIDLRSGATCGVEALARWQAPGGRDIPPDDFIPLAESSGLIVDLGESILFQAATETARWNAAAPTPLWVSVNLSARQLTDTHLAALVADILRTSGLAAGLLHLEVTETVLMEDVSLSISILEELKRSGVRLSIDDFGTGYSSLAYLQQLPVDMIKVDRSFVRDLGIGKEATSIVRAIISLGEALGMSCVAEGVETAVQHQALIDLGCPLGQGHLWSRALSPPDAEEWLARARRPQGCAAASTTVSSAAGSASSRSSGMLAPLMTERP